MRLECYNVAKLFAIEIPWLHRLKGQGWKEKKRIFHIVNVGMQVCMMGVSCGLTYCPRDDNFTISTSVTCHISRSNHWS